MSTSYRFAEVVSEQKFLEVVKKLGFTENKREGDGICITDGTNYLWFYSYDGQIGDCCRYGMNYDAEQTILSPIVNELQTRYFSEEQPEYWDDGDED